MSLTTKKYRLSNYLHFEQVNKENLLKLFEIWKLTQINDLKNKNSIKKLNVQQSFFMGFNVILHLFSFGFDKVIFIHNLLCLFPTTTH
jgi:hypothetical protein